MDLPKGVEFILFFFAIIYILSSIFISIEGGKRKIGMIKSIIICLFLTPIAGYFFLIKSKYKEPPALKRYKCDRCGRKFNHRHKYCPTCESNGRFIRLRTVS